ncbi:MAG: type II toxin-antitoxin system RelE/ParE family toxin [Pseudorhodoplanes sp.]
MKLRFTPRARDDLISILDYIDQRSLQGARNVKAAIHKTIEVIAQYPEGGRLAGEQQVRVLPAGRYPYLIYWSVESDGIWIVHIRHAMRRPWPRDSAE